jgi:hypothetical protein
MNLGILGKIGLLLVVIGFFMPIACNNDNGFEWAERLMKSDKTKLQAILMYVMFISAAVGVALGVLAFLGKELDPRIDWCALILCILSGIIIVISTSDNIKWSKVFNDYLKVGGYFIFIGWILAVVGQVLGSKR